MDLHMHPDPHISHSEHRASPVLSPSPAITPTTSKSRGLLTDLAGWPSYSDMRIQAPGAENSGGLHQSGSLSKMPSMTAPTPSTFQKSSHLPTPQSPGNNMASYLLTRTPTSLQTLQPDHESNALPTEFSSHVSSSPTSFRPCSIPTPDPSPLVAQPRSNGPFLLSQLVDVNSYEDGGFPTQCKSDDLRFRASTPPRTLSRQLSTRPATPVVHSRPATPLQQRLTERSPESFHLDNSTTNPTSPRIKDEPGADTARFHAQLIENNLASTQATGLRRPDYFKRVRHMASSSNAGGGGASLASDMEGKDGTLLWSSGNLGVIDSPIKGKRIALFQETSEESFEESLMAGGYGRYRSDGPSWKVDGDAQGSSQLGDATGEGSLGSESVLTEEERLKKTRLAAFLNPPRVFSTTQLLPVEIEGCGRVLIKVEPSESQTPPKPPSRAKRSRKRKKTSVDVKHEMDMEDVAAPEARADDGPNWPDTEFPWRFRLMAPDGLSSTEREERLRRIGNFLDRESDEDDVEEGHSSSGGHSPEAPSRSPRLGGSKTIPPLSHSRDRQRGSTVPVVSSDPADAKIALLSKKSIRAVQLRLLRRRNTSRGGDGDDSELLCICRERDDGRPLVQCDACRTWYHLECIGIRSTAELGREEDPWFCANCVEVKTPPPVVAALSEPTFALTDVGEHDTGYDPPFLNAGLHPSPATPWTRSVRMPTTPPRTQHAPHAAPGLSWDEPPSSSSRGDPRTPQFSASLALGDTARVYGMMPGRSLETVLPTSEESPFDPTSTPSRGIMFGLPFTTPKDGRWGFSSSQGARASGHELFHTPKRPGEDVITASVRYGHYHGRVGEASEEGPSVAPGLSRATGVTGSSDVTPVEGGAKRMQVMESPLGAKRSRRAGGS